MEGPFVLVNQVTPDYFRTMQIPLLRGRTFNSAEYSEKPSVMIVSSSLAHSLWPNQEALGKRLTTTYPAEWNEVVGVAADVPLWGGIQPFPQAYSPKYNTFMDLLVRTSGNPKGSMTPIRTLILAQDKDTGVASMMTMEESLAQLNGPLRYTAGVLGTMALIALLLATIGVYAVTAYSVSQRSHEFGIRMALGAQRGKVLMLVMRQGIRLSLLGIVIGLLITLALGRVLAFFLHGVAVGDVSTYLVVSLLFLLVTLLASYLPSRRATRIDPAAALRCE
jgi:putative ABC transport system permease protein